MNHAVSTSSTVELPSLRPTPYTVTRSENDSSDALLPSVMIWDDLIRNKSGTVSEWTCAIDVWCQDFETGMPFIRCMLYCPCVREEMEKCNCGDTPFVGTSSYDYLLVFLSG